MSRKILCHPLTRVTLTVLGFIAIFDWMRSISFAFHFYVGFVLGTPLLPLDTIRAIGLPVFAICVILLVLGVWISHSDKISLFHKIDASLLILASICVSLFCVRLMFSRHWSVFVVLFAPLLLYLCALFVLVQLTVRIRDESILNTAYWWKFFNLPHTLPKIGMATLLVILLAILTAESLGVLGLLTRNHRLTAASLIAPWGRWFGMTGFTVLFVCIVAAFTVLNYFAAFVLGLSAEYDAANTEKIHSERFKAELITNVSHDIRTPLTSIINYTNLLKNQQLQGEAATYVDVLDKKSNRLKQLLSDLIDASQASTGAVKMDIQPLNFSEILGQVAGEFSDIFDENGLTLVLRQPAEPLYVLADSRHLFRAMENVFSNAAKYSLPGTRVFAEIEAVATEVTLTLRNTSKSHIDVPAEALTEQFIRGDLARHSEGSGLGLHIAKSLIELMGGDLEINLRGDLFEVMIVLMKTI